MPQQVYLISYAAPKSTLIPAFNHWQIFLPKEDDIVGLGTVIHVPGNPFRGFQVEVAEKELSTEKTPLTKYPLCSIPSEDVEKLKRVAEEMGGLGVSKNPLSGEPNCQDWVLKLVNKCIEMQLLKEDVATQLNELKVSGA